jgi:hypothetical protein
MSENINVTEADVGNRILISTASHSDCVAVDREDIEGLIEELEQYVPVEPTFAERIDSVERVVINDKQQCKRYDCGVIHNIEFDRDNRRTYGHTVEVGPVRVTIESDEMSLTVEFGDMPEIEFTDDDEVLELTGETL